MTNINYCVQIFHDQMDKYKTSNFNYHASESKTKLA